MKLKSLIDDRKRARAVEALRKRNPDLLLPENKGGERKPLAEDAAGDECKGVWGTPLRNRILRCEGALEVLLSKAGYPWGFFGGTDDARMDIIENALAGLFNREFKKAIHFKQNHTLEQRLSQIEDYIGTAARLLKAKEGTP